MTLKTSLFNPGIYKNTLYRFKWGSFLYFIALFFMVPFALLVQEPANLWEYYHSSRMMGNIICSEDYLVFPVLLTMVVPTVVSALVFHNVHSQKQGIFVHGLPVSRKANYISNLLASFTLMALPVVLNGIILYVMSLNSYSQLILPVNVIKWMLELLSILFIMFSVSTFTAYITGNAAANIIVNIFIHLFPFVIYIAMAGIGSEFVYGFYYYQGSFVDKFIDWCPLKYLIEAVNTPIGFFSRGQTWVYLASAIVVYIATYFVYKFRKIEACGDVAAFKAFRTIIKYAVVFSVAVLSLCLLIALSLGWAVASIVAFVVCAIVYFACEMILSKSLKVFKSYKGYLVFAAVMAAVISFFAFTGVFGYETRIPDETKIESVSFGRNTGVEAYVMKNAEDIALVREFHKILVTDISEKEKTEGRGPSAMLHISYNLKNGKTLARRYLVPKDEFEIYMNKMFENRDYKFNFVGLDNINVENVTYFNLNCSNAYFSYGEAVTVGAGEIFKAIEKDVGEMSFTEIEAETSLNIDISLSATAKENKTSRVFKKVRRFENESEEHASEYFNISINGNYKNTMAVLKKYGYYDKIASQSADYMYICKIPASKNAEDIKVKYKNDEGNLHDFVVALSDCVKVDSQDVTKMVEDMFVSNRNIYSAEGEFYMLFCVNGKEIDRMYMSTVSAVYEKNELPEYLLKYLE